jgi:hypothetical protein
VHNLEIFLNPHDEMILECSLDDLMKEVWAEKFVDICTGKAGREWLGSKVSTCSGESEGGQCTRKSDTIP